MKTFTVALVAFMAGMFPAIMADVVIPDQRYLEAYTEEGLQGPHTEFFDYAPDLSVYGIDNAIKSFCATGSWILYHETNYENELTWLSSVHDCRNSSAYEEASSLRYAGSPYGLNDVYYNLYEGTRFTGTEFKGNTNAPTVGALDLNVSSLFINGQSPWTFFTGLEYTGPAVCVYPVYHEVEDGIEINHGGIYSMSDLGLPDNSIRSVAKGCFSKKIVGTPPSKAPPHPEGDHKVINNAH